MRNKYGQPLIGNKQYAVILHRPNMDPTTWAIFPESSEAYAYVWRMVLERGEYTTIERLPDLGSK